VRIAVLARRFDPSGGGTERDLLVTCDYLMRAGHQVTVYAGELRGKSSNIRAHRAPVLPWGRTLESLTFAYCAPLQARRRGADIVVSFGRTVGAEIQRCGGGVYKSYLKAARRWREPLSFRLMNLSPYRRVQAEIELQGFTSPRLRLVLAVSQSVRDDLVATFGLARETVATLYNGVDAERFRPAQDTNIKRKLRHDLGLPASAPVIAFVGNGFARKGLGFLLRAWPRLEGEPWLAVAGHDRDRRAFRRLAAQLGVAPRVSFLGALRDIAPLYQAVDGVALPTLFEAFGNVVLEAMASGLPVLVSRCAGVCELIPAPLRQFLVNDPSDLAELAVRLQMLLAAPAELSDTARAAAQELTWERYGTRLLELIEGACST
jgi:UDP-glucose:(heptosyl)LPS alpha-1,3-glucosyltransferase